MFNHIVLGSNDIAQSMKFYDAVLGRLGYGPGMLTEQGVAYVAENSALAIVNPINGEPADHGNGVTIGLVARNQASVDAFHADGVANGGTCAGAPGPRPQAPGNVYGAYLRDPEGNKLCAIFQMPL